MHQTTKGNQWYHRCAEAKGYGVDSESSLIHSVETTAAHVHDLIPASDLLHGEETLVYADAGYQGMGKRRALPDTPEGRVDDLVETAKAHIRKKWNTHSASSSSSLDFRKPAFAAWSRTAAR